MIVPKPPVALEGHCSVIHNNTLYTFSKSAFLSIPLQRNATWNNDLPMAPVPVSDAACVKGGLDGQNDQEALYIVGGTNAKGNPPGLQRYSFRDNQWKTIHAVDLNMSNRTSHRAVYLESSSSILVYGGHPDGQSIGSSDTFVINTTAPYAISAYPADKASPAYVPVLLPWSDQKAALVGGLTTPDKVHLFDPKNGWESSAVSLADPMSDDVQCAMIRASDGSKILQSFDMDAAPNTVTSIALLNPGGNPARPGKIVGQSSRKRKRGISLDNFPTYDNTFASSTKRQDYSLAQGDNNLVVISSGGGTDSLAIFNQSSNSWVNATKLFYGDQSQQQILATATSASPTATATGPSETTTAAGAAGGGTNNTGTIIGATLGSILGLGVILVLILLLIKRKKDKLKRAAQDQDKDRLSFQDQGMEPLTQSAYPMAKSTAPLAASSVDSLAIFSGNLGDEKSPRSAGGLPAYHNKHAPKPSPLSTIQSSRDAASTPGALDKAIEAQESVPSGGRPGDRRTNEGWSQYFQDNSATSLVGLQPPPTTTATTKSDDRTSVWPTTALAPLNFSFLEEPKPLGRVISGSPTTEHAASPKDGRHIAIPESQSARISSADSVSVASDDDYDRREDHPSRSWIGRPPSSTYSRSYYNPSTRDLPSVMHPPYESARASTNTRGSSVVIPDTLEPLPTRNTNINSDMSWLNLNAER
ncbi:predicted protein [Aspergillus terreus NIH2624]|uniref:Pre-mRNA splicing factor CLF1 n=1 Tax=Aspergillus terreus (strain NIH 2624 / FGSC A1156) TaxID=341663 RepID=Q0D1H2_ASPTN|nr:uncharacterized protein ATEG_00212 [Aspergillus terreus NIH2624]EAU38858.1 predicted protein [Aspergillus terreus NIH2624]